MKWAERTIRFVRRLKGNLQVRILLIILLFLFLPVFIMLNINLRQTERVTIKNTSELIMNNLVQIADKVEKICLDMITLSNLLLTDDTILESLADAGSGQPSGRNFAIRDKDDYSAADYARRTRIENQINSIKLDVFYTNNTDVVIIGADGSTYFSIANPVEELILKSESWMNVTQADWFMQIAGGKRAALWTVPYLYPIEGFEEDRHISFAKSLKNMYTPKETAGVMMINYSEENLGDIMGETFNGEFFLINDRSEMVTSSNQAMEANVLASREIRSQNLFYGSGSLITEVGGQKYMALFTSIPRFGYCAMSLVPYDQLTEDIDSLRKTIYAGNVFIFIAFFVVGIALIYTLSPLRHLVRRARGREVGPYKLDIDESEELNEVDSLTRSFDKMLDDIQDLVRIVVEEQKQESDLRYQVLRAQINPHFLFNTLNTIKWSAKLSGAANVADMISALGRLLEVSMDNDTEEITLREELELVENYLYIQNIRYNDKFSLQVQVAGEELYGDFLLKLMLQPIVENSIIHGFADKDEDCVIWIDARHEDGQLIVSVTDNGTGFAGGDINQLLEGSQTSRQRFSGIGLTNINERVRLKYGSGYGIRIDSEEGRGTRVTVKLPILKAAEHGRRGE